MKRLTDDSVMRQLCNVVRLRLERKEYKKLVSAGGAAVEHAQKAQHATHSNPETS